MFLFSLKILKPVLANRISLSRELINASSWRDNLIVLWTLNKQAKIFLGLKPVIYYFLIYGHIFMNLWLSFPILKKFRKKLRNNIFTNMKHLDDHNIILVQNVGKKI